MKLKRIITFVLSSVLAFCLASCGTADTVSKIEKKTVKTDYSDSVTLLYSDSDTFNPYTVKTDVNRQLCQLIFDSLVTLENSFNPVNLLAQSVRQEGNSWIVELKDAKFSDGSSLTSDDVVYSYNLAKKSSTVYASRLYEVSSVSASGSHTVIFNLTVSDPFFANLLLFPIIKAGSELITDSDGVYYCPIGTGRFKLNDTADALVINGFSLRKSGQITSVKLINAPDLESVTHYTQVGAADMYYSDISDGNILRMSGKKQSINLNTLVYIGVNQNNAYLSNEYLRQAISSGVDRTEICHTAYFDNAVPANGFFHPSWQPTTAVQNIQITANQEITVENLGKIGYNITNGNKTSASPSNVNLKFNLLVNKENRIRVAVANSVATQLSTYGITLNVIEKSYEQYLEDLKNGNFDLFVGEIKITENMDLSPLLVKGNASAFGLYNKALNENPEGAEQPHNRSEEIIKGFYSGANSISDVAFVLQNEMPFIPLLYRLGILFFNDNIENVNISSQSDIFASIESYIYSK